MLVLRVGGFPVSEHPGKRPSSRPEVGVERLREPIANILRFHQPVLQPSPEDVEADKSGVGFHFGSMHLGFPSRSTVARAVSPAMFKTAQPPTEDLMGLISGLLGHSSKADVSKLQQEFQPILVDGENLVGAYKVLRDMIVFTNKRLILVDKQGMTSSKTEYQSIPYARIVRFSKESAGILDLEAELKIWIVGQPLPITKTFGKNENVNEVYQILSQAVLD